MTLPLVSIVGSANPNRTGYDPAVDIAGACRAARELGIALARAGWRIAVYSREFIEAEAVVGYASVKDAPNRGIVVRYSQGKPDHAKFPELMTREHLFENPRRSKPPLGRFILSIFARLFGGYSNRRGHERRHHGADCAWISHSLAGPRQLRRRCETCVGRDHTRP